MLASSGVFLAKNPTFMPDTILGYFGIPDVGSIISASIFGLAGLYVLIAKNNSVGGVILIIGALTYLTTVGRWVIAGFPEMLKAYNAPWYLITPMQVFMGFIIFMFVMELIAQRDLT
jgi:hypothetical protein